MKKLMMLVVAVAAAMMARAATETVGGNMWTDCIDGGVAENVIYSELFL